MLRRKMVLGLVVVGVIGGCWIAQALSQERQGRRERRGNPEEWRQRMEQRVREQLAASDDEWKVLKPRLQKVQRLQGEARAGFGGRFGRGRGGRGGEARPRPEGAPEREQPDVEKKAAALRSLLEDKASDAKAVKAGLDAYRKAREISRKELAAARKELLEILDVRKEASLVLMGMLD